jgi:hypothetical protein
MSDYEIGYGKPPRNGRFKPGVSGNPKGRPKRGPLVAEEIISRVLNAPMTYHDRGRAKIATRQELVIKQLVDRAVAGDPLAAEDVLKFRMHAQRFGSEGSEKLEVSDWLPDYAGQTGQQKTKVLSEKGVADHTGDFGGLDSDQRTEAHQGPDLVSD